METMSLVKSACRKYIAEEINWEQRRYEIAKDVLAGFAASDRGVLIADAQTAVKFADALIKALKG